ncbi:hypothetical protein GC1_00015 [Gluconobacter phage GC1]|uniref:Uncharacterized protein n=1 Tax=Gluconobacter phage GC1 TaxID=2047788 RepID=A0A2I5AR76_9VIRU|nr:hypothetical protein FDJ08_gp15 [Gluconobacter phage GC1]ATS92583.1 hypothetical protein GC1_00015 [Gluconobacter phage GC1]
MSQASKIMAFLALAFVVFITAKGELPTYLGFFKIGDDTGSGENAVKNFGKKSGSSILGGFASAGISAIF